MKKLALIIIGIFMLVGCDAPAMNYEVKDNGPDGFFGLKWKSTVNEALSKHIIFPGRMYFGSYNAETRQNTIGDIILTSSTMFFYKDQFYNYQGRFSGEEKYDRIKTALLEKYGDPDYQKLKHIIWKFNHSAIILNYEDEKGIVSFTHIELLSKRVEAAEDINTDL